MELLVLIFFLWLVGVIFPGSGRSGFGLDQVACFLAGVLFLALLFCAYWGMVAGIILIGEWLGFEAMTGWLLFALFGPVVIPMIIAGVVNSIAEQRRVVADK